MRLGRSPRWPRRVRGGGAKPGADREARARGGAGPRAAEPQRLRHDPLSRATAHARSDRPRTISHAPARRAGPSWPTSGWASSAWPSARCSTATASPAPTPRRLAPPDGRPHFPPRAKRVIWLMMRGGVSHLESFDPKPELTRHAGKTIDETPVQGDGLRLALPQERPRAGRATTSSTSTRPRSTRLQVGFQKGGQSGHRGQRLVAARPRAASTTSPSSARCGRPTTTTAPSSSSSPAGTCSTAASRRSAPGSTTASGALSDDLPQFISMGPPLESQCVRGDRRQLPRPRARRRDPQGRPDRPAALRPPRAPVGRAEERGRRPTCSGGSTGSRPSSIPTTPAPRPDQVVRAGLPDADGRARGPPASRDEDESTRTRSTASTTTSRRPFGQQCLAARRLVERGVRFVQVFHGDGAAGAWDAHAGLRAEPLDRSAARSTGRSPACSRT